jgi:cytochrome c-type biogenesis protein CcmH
VLKDEPQNPQALVLAGTDAFFRSNFADAVRHWEAVLAMLPPGSPDAQNLAAGIEKAKSQLGAGKASASPNTSPKAGTEAAGKTVSGRVDLAPALKARPRPTTWYSSSPAPPKAAHAAGRGAYPRRRPATGVHPRRQHGAQPEFKLSSAGSLRIEARVSRSGDATAKPGDLRGESGPVQPGARKLSIVIDKVVE